MHQLHSKIPAMYVFADPFLCLCLRHVGIINRCSRMMAGLTTTITEDGGVWRIQKMNKAPVIEVFKVAESGYGDILLKEFIEWRCRPSQKRTL